MADDFTRELPLDETGDSGQEPETETLPVELPPTPPELVIGTTKHSEVWVFFHFLKWALRYWDKLVLSVISSFLQITLSLIWPWLGKFMVDEAFPNRNWKVFWAVFFAGIVINTFDRIKGTLQAMLNAYINTWVLLRLKIHFFRHLQRLSMTFLQNRPIGEHMYRANADIAAVMRMITDILPLCLQSIFEFSLILLFTSFLDWRVTILVLIYSIPYTALAHWIATRQRHIDRDQRRRWQRYDAGVQEGVAGAMVIKTFARHKYEVYRYMHLYFNAWRQNMKFWWMDRVREHSVGALLPWLKEQLLRIWFFRMVIMGELTYGSVFPILSYMNRLTSPIQQIVDYIQQIRVALIPAERILETLEVEPAVKDRPGATRMPTVEGHVAFDHVSFSYEDGRRILNDVTFDANPGQRIAIVGHSGSGKSTIVNLLLRLYDPDEGGVQVDGHDLRDVRANSYQDQVGLVMQETYLFGGTIRDNILFGEFNATDDDMIRAARLAEIHDWVMDLPNGYDSDLSEGTKLSVGQKQRIGLARALVRNPQLLIFDEPTSSLDSPTEQKIMTTFRNAAAGRTAIWVSHRMNTVIDADLILVVAGGQIVERGTHEELLALNLHYRALWSAYYGLSDEDNIAA